MAQDALGQVYSTQNGYSVEKKNTSLDIINVLNGLTMLKLLAPKPNHQHLLSTFIRRALCQAASLLSFPFLPSFLLHAPSRNRQPTPKKHQPFNTIPLQRNVNLKEDKFFF